MESFSTKVRSIEYIKLLAACFVVFIHIHFPGTLGKVFDSIARFGVPFFFVISGFFSYQIKSERVLRRMLHILMILLLATLLYTVWGGVKTVIYSNGTLSKYLLTQFNWGTIARWLFMDICPVAGHLWFLMALIKCYAVFWLYVKLNENTKEEVINYGPFYIFGSLLLMIHIMTSLKMVGIGMKVNYIAYRDGLFFGLPMFCTGLYIKENYEKIHCCFNLSKIKSVLVFMVGTALGVLQYLKIGKVEMPVGTFFAVCALLMFAVEQGERESTSILKDRFAYVLGKTSVIVYIIHIMCSDIIKFLAKTQPVCQTIVNHKNVYPLIILFISLTIGLFVSFVLCWYRRLKRSVS